MDSPTTFENSPPHRRSQRVVEAFVATKNTPLFWHIFGWIIAAIVLILNFAVYPAFGQVQSYTTLWQPTNFYADEFAPLFVFTGLDASTEYSWTLQVMRIDSPTQVDFNAQTVFCSGTTACGVVFDEQFIPDDTLAPARVVDNFGQVLSKHFIAPKISASWSTDQTTDADEKQVIDFDRPSAVNPSGYHHDRIDFEGLMTVEGDYSLFHYRTLAGTYASEAIQVSDIDDASVLANFLVSEFVEYNSDRTGGLAKTVQQFNSFVIINTSGVKPFFIDSAQDSFAMVAGTNPHTLTTPIGMYDYARHLGALPTVVSNGEAVWMVGSWIPDWSGTSRGAVTTEKNQFVVTRAIEEDIFDAYDQQAILDCEGSIPTCDTVDSTNYAFATRREIVYEVDPAAFDSVTIMWERKADALNYAGADPDDFALYKVLGVYDRVAAQGLDERIEELVLESGIGRETAFLLIFMLAVIITFGILAQQGVTSPTVYGGVFVSYGVLFLVAGFFTSWIMIITGLLLVVVLFGMVKGTRNAT